jgi:integral membrane protein (TIGR01906 family)
MKVLSTSLRIILVIIVPVFIMMTAIRFLITPIFPQFEYNAPGFPPDPYGFTKEDRLKYSAISIDFLTNESDITYFNQYNLPNGAPLYNERELSHMRDVKILIQQMILVWGILAAVLVLAGLFSLQTKALGGYFTSLSRGGWATLIIIGLILVGVALSFTWLFTEFHRMFFSGDTWLFYYSDSLIRLFPMQFWQDAFIWMGVFAIFLALIFGVLGRMAVRRFSGSLAK